MGKEPQPDLIAAVTLLGRHHPTPFHPVDPLQLILWENVGYLIDDERRRALFDAFGQRIGFDAGRIAAADDAVLMSLASAGGMRPEQRVEDWRRIAGLVLEECQGRLDQHLRELPLAKARTLLRRFPGIGEPGADKVLLFADIAVLPCLDSNGLRSLARLGFFDAQGSYGATYRAAIEVLKVRGRGDREWLVEAYLVLREHGKMLCKRAAPLCWACPLDETCPHVAVTGM